jgi:clan AA aspartic protease
VILGTVTANRDAVIVLVVRGPSGHEHRVEAVIDTGFNGWFSLPPELITSLDLPWRRRGRAVLADGSESVFDIYEAVVEWDGVPRRVVVDEASTAPLVGMALLDGYELNVEVRTAGRVTVGILPRAASGQSVQ